MSMVVSRRYEGLSPKAYEHPADRAATAALRSIPLMDKALKLLSGMGYEKRLRQVLTGDAVEISARQLPELWARHAQAASVLDVARVPQLYVTQTPMVNAMTIGSAGPMVILYSSLVTDYSESEVDAVLAHEMGHVLSEHVYYQTALEFLAMLLMGPIVLTSPISALPLQAIYLVLLEWSRAAELSADRASVLVRDDPRATCQMLMRLAGGPVPGMSLDAFLAQAARYADEDDLLARWSRAKWELRQGHPIAVKRARELMAWVADGSFDRIRGGSYIRKGQEPPLASEVEGAVAHYRQRFVRILETAGGGVDRALRQVEDWLKRRGNQPADDD